MLRVFAAIGLVAFLGVEAEAACTPYWEWTSTSYGITLNQQAVADVNGDGVADVVQVSATAVARSLGNSATSSFGRSLTLATGTAFSGVQVADFTGDAKPDIAMLDTAANAIVLLGGAGDGTFSAPVTTPLGTAPSEFTAGDFDGDQIRDLVVRNAGSVRVWRGRASGVFASGGARSFSASATGLVAADFNGDEKTDVLAAQAGSSTLLLFAGNGDATLDLPIGVTGVATTHLLDAADLDDDADIDVLSSNPDQPLTLNVLLNRGDGTFDLPAGYDVRPPFSTSLRGLVRGIATGDVNGDGKVDVVAANSSDEKLATLLGRGDGTFDDPRFSELFDQTDFGRRFRPDFVDLADLSGDGRLDVVAGAGSYSRAIVAANTCGDTTTVIEAANPMVSVGDSALLRVDVDPASDGTVTVLEGATELVTVPLAPEIEVLLSGVGSHTLHVRYDGTPEWHSSVSNDVVVSVTAGTTTATFTLSTSNAVYGEQFYIFPSVTSTLPGTPGGSFALYRDGVEVDGGPGSLSDQLFSVGTYSYQVRFLGDAEYPPSPLSEAQTVIVDRAPSTIAFTSAPPFTNAYTNANFGVAPSQAGRVTLFDGTLQIAAGEALAASSTVYMTAQLQPGLRKIRARYEGAENYQPSETTVEVFAQLDRPLFLDVHRENGTVVAEWWDSAPGIETYVLQRVVNGVWQNVRSGSSAAPWVVAAPQLNAAYVYRVQGLDAGNAVVATSNIDGVVFMSFTDDPLASGATRVKAAHFTELLTAANAMRAAAGSGAISIPGLAADSVIRASHAVSLRQAVNDARALLGMPVWSFADTVAPATLLRAQQIEELRAAVR